MPSSSLPSSDVWACLPPAKGEAVKYRGRMVLNESRLHRRVEPPKFPSCPEDMKREWNVVAKLPPNSLKRYRSRDTRNEKMIKFLMKQHPSFVSTANYSYEIL